MPTPAARIRSARLPWGTSSSSSSIRPARQAVSKCQESGWRGNEHTILRTRPSRISAARPWSPLPALLLTTVSPVAQPYSRASISATGCPAEPNPPTSTVAPSGTPATASAAVPHISAAYAWPDLARQVLEVYRQVTGPGHGGGTR